MSQLQNVHKHGWMNLIELRVNVVLVFQVSSTESCHVLVHMRSIDIQVTCFVIIVWSMTKLIQSLLCSCTVMGNRATVM